MNQDELIALFDHQAAGYDRQWDAVAPVRDALYLVANTAFLTLPDEARILSVGVGTGTELAHLAVRFPGWQFTAVEPSRPMLEVCRRRAEAEGFAERCTFHSGYLDTLPDGGAYDGATCFLVSQFILARDSRTKFFAGIANRLRPGGVLVTADLAARPAEFDTLVHVWMRLMVGGDVPPERMAAARATYRKDVAVIAPDEVAAIIRDGGFTSGAQIFQAGLLHAWSFRRT